MPSLLKLHSAVTWLLVGLIWVVQLVHYPMFSRLDRATYQQSHAFHTGRITWIVAPAMLLELALASLLYFRRPDRVTALGLALVCAIWIVTAFVMVPLHQRLSQGFDAEAQRALVRWNWLRTAAWSLRGVLALLWL